MFIDIALLLVGLAILGLLVLIVLTLRSQSWLARINNALDAQLTKLAQGLEHHAEVHAVLALTKQVEADPEALRKLESYTASVVAAALKGRVENLATQYASVLKRQTWLVREHAANGNYEQSLERVNLVEEQLRDQLEAAQADLRAYLGTIDPMAEPVVEPTRV